MRILLLHLLPPVPVPVALLCLSLSVCPDTRSRLPSEPVSPPHVTHSLPLPLPLPSFALSTTYLRTTRLKWWRPRLHEWGSRRRPWGGQGKRSFYFQTLPSVFACCPRRRMPNHHTRQTPSSPTPAASSCPVLSCQIITILVPSIPFCPRPSFARLLSCQARAHVPHSERLELLSTNITTHV